MQEQPKTSWWGRNWKWLVPLGCLVPALGCGGVIAGIFFATFSAIKSTEPYKESLAAVKQNARVQTALGSPIDAGLLVGENIRLENADGEANLNYSVAGPNAKATVYVDATKKAGQWTYHSVIVDIDATGARIEIPME